MFLISTMFASPPVGMLAYMLKVAEGWPPTRPRLSREDRQRLNQGTALCLTLSSFYSSDTRNVQQIPRLPFTPPQSPSVLLCTLSFTQPGKSPFSLSHLGLAVTATGIKPRFFTGRTGKMEPIRADGSDTSDCIRVNTVAAEPRQIRTYFYEQLSVTSACVHTHTHTRVHQAGLSMKVEFKVKNP